MKISIKVLAVIIVNIACYLAKGDDLAVPDPSAIPASSWESHPAEGIDLAMMLINQDKKPLLLVYVKNTSNGIKELAGSKIDGGFKLFFLDSNGVRHDLHDYDPRHGSGSADTNDINSGEILSNRIALTPNDLVLMKSHPIQCSFRIYDLTAKQDYDLISSPKTFAF